MPDLIDTPWNSFETDTSPQARISKTFRLYELTRSETATRQMIDNSFPGTAELQAAVYLCRTILQPIRDEFGPLNPNSVFRSQALERALKKKPDDWVSKSQHALGQACDVEVTGLATLDLAKWVSNNLDFDQLICECYNPAKGPNSGWVHISCLPPGSGDNRHNELSYIYNPENKRYVYVAAGERFGVKGCQELFSVFIRIMYIMLNSVLCWGRLAYLKLTERHRL